MLTSGCTHLPEVWCMHGMEWVGCRVFERGYWKNNDKKSKEVKLLDASDSGEVICVCNADDIEWKRY